MKESFKDLPGWTFELEEVSANVYEVTGISALGHRVQMKGLDPDALLDDARKGAQKIQNELSSR